MKCKTDLKSQLSGASEMNRDIYCCECGKDVSALLITGREVYPHRQDLYGLPFWQCQTCYNFVGCHHKTKNKTKPLGVIANKAIKNARVHIHALIDPIWKNGKTKRSVLYKQISDEIGYSFHASNIRSIDEARSIYKSIQRVITGN